MLQAVRFVRVESCPAQFVLPPGGLAADKIIHDRYSKGLRSRDVLQNGITSAPPGAAPACHPDSYCCCRSVVDLLKTRSRLGEGQKRSWNVEIWGGEGPLMDAKSRTKNLATDKS